MALAGHGDTSITADSSFSRRFWRKYRHEASFPLLCPFALCYAAGNLQLDDFMHFVAKNDEVLRAFPVLLQLAAKYAGDDDARNAISKLRMRIKNIPVERESFLDEWYSDVKQDAAIDPDTLKFTDFLWKIASGRIEIIKVCHRRAFPAYVLGVIASFMRLFAFLAAQFELVLVTVFTHRYKKWIEYYASESFQASAQETEDLLDRLSGTLSFNELENLENVYRHALRRGVDFLCAPQISQLSATPLISLPNSAEYRLMFFSAYDLTCTSGYSSSMLADEAKSTEESKERWNIIQGQFKYNYDRCVAGILSANNVGQFNYASLVHSLIPLSECEKMAITRVADSRLLRGLELLLVGIIGALEVLRQPECMAFFRELASNNKMEVDINILSRCWCAQMIRSSFDFGKVYGAKIYSNELVFDDRSISTGQIVGMVETHMDKFALLRNIMRSTSSDKKNFSIYVGHDLGDLLCLLEADIGIVINCSPSLRDVGLSFGMCFVPLFQGLVRRQKDLDDCSPFSSNKKTGILYTVSSWSEIHAFILGHSV